MKYLLITVTTLFLYNLSLKAQDAGALLEKLVEKNILTQNEADELRTDSEQPGPTASSDLLNVRDIFTTPYMKFGGYGLFWYRYNQYDKSRHDMGTRVIFLTMSGYLTEQFRYYILGELTDPMIYEFYGEWMPSTAFNLRGGQYKVPFTLENPMSLTVLETVSNTRSISSLVGMTGDPLQYSSSKPFNKSGRDAGIQASGSLIETDDRHFLHYAAGIFQGTGINVKENNNTKDFVGTVIIQPIKEWRIAAGLYAGKAAVFDTEGEKLGNYGRNRQALSMDWKSERIYARTEWIWANDGGIKKEGLYGTASYYFIPKKLNLTGKIDYLNRNKDTNNEVMDYVAAVNYYFYKDCRFQLNYTYSDFSKNREEKHSSENRVQLQMQIVF